MNKSILLLFYILSIATFSCSAMETVKNDVQKHLSTLSNYAYSQEPMRSKTSQKNYRQAVDEFNKNAELLKKNLEDTKTLWAMINNLEPIQREVSFIVSTINHLDENTIKELPRIIYMKKTIKRFNNTSTPFTIGEITDYQKAVTKITDFSISKKHNTNLQPNLSIKTEISAQELLKLSDLELETDPELLTLFSIKKETVQEKKRQAHERQKQILSTEKQQKNPADQIKKTTQLKPERLKQEEVDLKIQELEKIVEQEISKTEKINAEKLAKLELEKINAEQLKLQQKEKEKLAKIKDNEKLENEKLNKLLENQQKISEQGKATTRRYIWAGVGLIGLTVAAIIYYYKLHTKYVPWLSRA